MKKIVCYFCLFAILLLTACTPKQGVNVDYSRLPVEEYSITFYNPEDYVQLIYDTPQSRYMAHIIELSLVPNGIVNITGDFTGIGNAPMDKLINQAIFHTPAIAYRGYSYFIDDKEYVVAPCKENHIVAITAKKAEADGKALENIYYADDIEQTLIYLYGDYPIAGQRYRDHFIDGENLEYYAKESLILQRFDWGIVPSAAQILALHETEESISCDFVTVARSITGAGYEVEYQQELTVDNFLNDTAKLDVMRFTYHYSEDDGRPILYNVKTLGTAANYFQSQENLDVPYIISHLNQVLDIDEVSGYFGETSREFTCIDLDNTTIYHATTYMGLNTVVCYDKNTHQWGTMDLGKYAAYEIRGFFSKSDDTDKIGIHCRSTYFGGDYQFANYDSIIYYSLQTKAIDDVIFNADEGVFGMVGSRDFQQYKDYSIEQDTAVFCFERIPGGSGNGYDGPEIIVSRNYSLDLNTSIFMFAFRNTQMNLPDSFIRQVRAMNGISRVDISYEDSALFSGTVLIVYPHQNYQVQTVINQSGNTEIFEDFSFRCIPRTTNATQ